VLWGVTESRDTTVPRSIDLPGLVAVVLGITAVTFGIDRANEWDAAATIGLIAVGLLLLVAFVLRERAARWPLVHLELFRNRPYVIVTLMATVANVAFVVATFSITIFLQQAQGYTPLEAGLIFLAASAAAGVAGPMSGRLGERFEIPRTIAVATVVGAVGLLVVSLESDLGFYVPALAVFGIGYGTGWAMASVGTQTVVPPEKAGEASGLTLTIVIGLAGLALAAAAMLLEVGSGGGTGLGTSIEELLRWVAIGSAALAASLAILAALIMPRRSAGGQAA
jgi:MFS family permease